MKKYPGIVQWPGGKGLMVAKLRDLIPYTKIYCEPFGGAAAMLFNRRPSSVEIYNDLNGDLVNLFRCFQDKKRYKTLYRKIKFTLYSFDEFKKALFILKHSEDLDERAWAFYVCQNQGFGGVAGSEGRWGRAFVSMKNMALTCSSWLSRFDTFEYWKKRIERVQIDNRCALEVIKYWDSPETTFYLDPPYVLNTRPSKKIYGEQEQDNNFHRKLIDLILSVKGNVIISCYNHEIYKPLEIAGWQKIEFKTFDNIQNCKNKPQKNKSKERIEVVYRKIKTSFFGDYL